MAERFFNSDYKEHAVLSDGSHVTLRLIRPEDKHLLTEGFSKLSPEARYLRFFTGKGRLTEGELHYFTEVDQEHHFALGALARSEDGKHFGVGIARFVCLKDDPTVAEPAFTILDDWQGLGLGRLLFQRLMAAARERGVERFRIEVLRENHSMLDLIDRTCSEAVCTPSGPVMQIEFRIPDVPPQAGPEDKSHHSPFYRFFRRATDQSELFQRASRALTQLRASFLMGEAMVDEED